MAASNEEKVATLAAHLEALRRTLIHCLLALGIGIVPMFLLAPYALDLLSAKIVEEVSVTLHYFSPMEVFLLQLKLAALLDAIICFPVVAFEIWKFVLPALYDDERKFLRGLVWLSSGLFFVGVVFFLTLCFPLILKFGASFSSASLEPIFGISNIVSLGIWLSLAFGCMFQFPIVTYALVRWEIISYDSMRRKRPYVAIAILVLAALLTPPDVVSQIMLGAPTYLLFETGLFFSRKYREAPTMKESRDRRDIQAFDVFAPNGGTRAKKVKGVLKDERTL